MLKSFTDYGTLSYALVSSDGKGVKLSQRKTFYSKIDPNKDKKGRISIVKEYDEYGKLYRRYQYRSFYKNSEQVSVMDAYDGVGNLLATYRLNKSGKIIKITASRKRKKTVTPTLAKEITSKNSAIKTSRSNFSGKNMIGNMGQKVIQFSR